MSRLLFQGVEGEIDATAAVVSGLESE